MTPLEWMEEMRVSSQKLLKLIVDEGMDDHVKELEREIQVKHIARDLAMLMITMNRWIAKDYYETKFK